MMQRRGFLGAILAAGMAPAFIGSKILMPVRALALPGTIITATGIEGLAVGDTITIAGSNELLTIAAIAREAFRVLEDNILFESTLGRKWRGPVAARIAEDGLTGRMIRFGR